MRWLARLLPALLLSGCWQSDADLYAGVTPVTPFRSGPIAVIAAGDADISRQQLTLDGTAYRIDGGKDDAVMIVRFHPLPGAQGYLVADVVTLASCATGACEKGPHSYAVLHPLADGRAEEMAQNRDDGMAEKIGAVQKGFVCEFTDRATLEKALRTLVTLKPTATISLQ